MGLWWQLARFTPTGVGNTKATRHSPLLAPVHPHVRGEYAVKRGKCWRCAGSPPRAWGIRQLLRLLIRNHRFTPTCVGNTQAPILAHLRYTVHPHVRGEYIYRVNPPGSVTGSPPRAWGIHGLFRCAVVPGRFTPTCVGNTYISQCRTNLPPVHPHVRGEYAGTLEYAHRYAGSPPRAWGIRRFQATGLPHRRFTPTCVGNTTGVVLTGGGMYGSPPRAWGIQGGPNRCR